MPTKTRSALQEFHDFLGSQLTNETSDLSPEEALRIWREKQESIASIERGLEDVDAGRVKPADEVLSNLGQSERR